MDCREVQEFIHPYLDGEFADQERSDFAEHIYRCDGCRKRVEFEERFRHRLRESTAKHACAPPWLRAKVIGALDTADRPEGWFRRWAWRALPAAVAATFVVGVWFSGEEVVGVTSASLAPLAEESILWHRKQLPLDVPGPKTEPIRRFFSDKLPFAVKPPRFRDSRVKLVGARLTSLRQHPVAYLVYQVDGERLSVFVLGDQVVPQLGRRHGVEMHVAHGYNVALYANHGIAYAVTSEMDPRQLTRLVVAE